MSHSLENRKWQDFLKDNSVTEKEEEIQFLMLLPLGVAPPATPTQCLLCRKILSTANTLKRHKRGHTDYRPFTCTICKTGYHSTTTARNHILKHLETAEPKEEWRAMMEKLPIDDSVEESLITSEVGPTALTSPSCELCKTLITNESRVEHYRAHIGLRPYKCLVCGKGFSSKSMIKVHCEIHLREKKNEKIGGNDGKVPDARKPSTPSTSGTQPKPLPALLLADPVDSTLEVKSSSLKDCSVGIGPHDCPSSILEMNSVRKSCSVASEHQPEMNFASLLASSTASTSEVIAMRSVSDRSEKIFGKKLGSVTSGDSRIQVHFSPLTPISNQTTGGMEEVDGEVKDETPVLFPAASFKRTAATTSSNDTGPITKCQFQVEPPRLPEERQRIENEAETSNGTSEQNTQTNTLGSARSLPGYFPETMKMPSTMPMLSPSGSNRLPSQNQQFTSTALNPYGDFPMPNGMQPTMHFPRSFDFSTNQSSFLPMPSGMGQIPLNMGQMGPNMDQMRPSMGQMGPNMGQMPTNMGQMPSNMGQMPPNMGQRPHGTGQMSHVSPRFVQQPNFNTGHPNSYVNPYWNDGFYPNMGSFQQYPLLFSPNNPSCPDPRIQAEFNSQPSGSGTKR